MPYYIAEIRFDRTNRNTKRDGRMGKRLALRLFTLILLSLLVSTSIVTIKATSGHRPICDIDCCDCDDNDYCDNDCWMRPRDKLVIKSLKRLRRAVSRLPKQAFNDPENAKCQKKELRSMISAVIKLIKHEEYDQALNMLEKIENAIREWIRHCWQTYLIKKVRCIVWLIEWILCRDRKPPTIVTVLSYPETPNYDEPVTVMAYVIDKQSGVELVNLSYSINTINWFNVTMESIDGLYVAEIQPQPYNVTVNYKVYAWDEAGNLAISETYSYVVTDSYPPVISYVDRTPASPNYNENVTVFANVTEPLQASGVKNVTLWYRTDSDWQHAEMILDQLYTGIIPAFPYGTVVQYKVQAFDCAGNSAASSVYSYRVGAPPNLPPVAIFTQSAETVLVGEVIHFNASESYDPDGYIVSYFWNFGDGTNATGVIADHAYANSGTYTVTLKVTDDDGAVDFASSAKTVLPPVLPNQPPVAVFSESAATVFTGEVIKFDASASYDLDGTIVSYSWDLGDGNVATGVSVEHSYADDGIYNVTLTVTDDDGATDTGTSTKYVRNRPPVASFTESAETIYTGEVVTFNATDAYDPDGVIDSYFWDFGDGTNATSTIVDHTYVDDGVYIVTLTVTDDDGSTATATSIKTVSNRPPDASFSVSATSVLTGEDIHFNAADSEDSDGHIIGYIWDFGDGASAAGISVSHAYEDNGVYTVTLTVIDDDGAISSTSAVETVLNRPPVALFTENMTTVKENEAIHFDASESYDPDGLIVNYFWDFGDGTNTTGQTVNHAFVEEGNYTVTLTITDDDGASSSLDARITVEAAPAELPLAWLAVIVLVIVALTMTAIYILYSRRRRQTATKPESKPIVTFYVPAEILVG